ncbi:hypothetical protein CBR_g29264 [Chara braunii]|uniref:Uncharacterized protein n=1 Tax=Chara braunii TaxID=69332 RepID=A0A388LAA2_CHABU|nr:hypothetical protein CBR_g29264 [Chara braunii]|eukprot:GBG79214.1 hypothetical protein CBR_g29264 [Chara braunii]
MEGGNEDGRAKLTTIEKTAVAAAVTAVLFCYQQKRALGRMRAQICAEEVLVEGLDTVAIIEAVVQVVDVSRVPDTLPVPEGSPPCIDAVKGDGILPGLDKQGYCFVKEKGTPWLGDCRIDGGRNHICTTHCHVQRGIPPGYICHNWLDLSGGEKDAYTDGGTVSTWRLVRCENGLRYFSEISESPVAGYEICGGG